MPKPANHSAETRAAVMAALLAGQSVSQVAKEYKLPKGTVSNWKNRTQRVPSDGTQKPNSVGDLLLTLVERNLQGLIAAADLMRDDAWMKKQGAAELGTFLGITHDKTMRMLEAMSTADADPDAG